MRSFAKTLALVGLNLSRGRDTRIRASVSSPRLHEQVGDNKRLRIAQMTLQRDATHSINSASEISPSATIRSWRLLTNCKKMGRRE